MILFHAWIAMLLIGAAHDLDGRVPTVGYWTLVILAFAARMLLTDIQTTTAKKADKPKPLIVNQTINNNGKARA